MTEKTIANIPAQAGSDLITRISNDPMIAYADGKIFNQLYRGAKMLAASDLTPEAYKDKPENCFSAMIVAARMHITPWECMQHLNIIHGKASWSSTFMIARMKSSDKYTTLDWEWTGDKGSVEWGARMYGLVRGFTNTDGLPIVHRGPVVTVAMAKTMGWWDKKGSAWPKMTQLMLQYRSASFFARTFCPEATLGFQSKDEVLDTGPDTPIADYAHAEDLTESLKAAATTVEGEAEVIDDSGDPPGSNPLDDEQETVDAAE